MHSGYASCKRGKILLAAERLSEKMSTLVFNKTPRLKLITCHLIHKTSQKNSDMVVGCCREVGTVVFLQVYDVNFRE